MNPYDLNDFLKRNNLPKSNNNTPIKSPKDDSNQNQMKLLLKNKNLQSQHKGFFNKYF